MSKAAGEDKIVLWKVTGFNSARPPPTSATAPKTKDYLPSMTAAKKTYPQKPQVAIP
jgi:hypothetical protein